MDLGSASFWVIQTLNGLSFGMLLFLLASGLSLSFGLMRILNLTHGSFFLLGGYVAITVGSATGSFLLAILAATAVVGVVGMVIHVGLLRRVSESELAQVLLTIGLLFVMADLMQTGWGASPRRLPAPDILSGALPLLDRAYPRYRLFVIVLGVVVVVALLRTLDRSLLGARIRAGVDDSRMLQELGQNVPRLFTLTFGAGAALAGLGGAVASPVLGAYPGQDFEVLTLALVVVVIGGLGSIRGALVASLLVGLIDSFARAIAPDVAMFTIYVPMVVMLVVKPHGLLGRAEA